MVTIYALGKLFKLLNLLKTFLVSADKNEFVIRKEYTSFVVSVQGYKASVRPTLNHENKTGFTVANSLEAIARTKLLIDKPDDPVACLKRFYYSLAWRIEDGGG